MNTSSSAVTAVTEEPLDPCLEYMDLSHHGLTEIPSDLKDHYPALKILDVSNNHITSIEPNSLPLGLVELRIYGNPLLHLNNIPDSVLVYCDIMRQKRKRV